MWDTSDYGYVCPRCGGILRIRSGKWGEFFGCSNYPRCRHIAEVGIDREPVEKPPKEVRDARIRAHKYFDRLWKRSNKHHKKHNGPVFGSRHDAYAWLRKVMGLPAEEAHMKQMSAEQCNKVVYESRMLLYDDFRERNSKVFINFFGLRVYRPLKYEERKSE